MPSMAGYFKKLLQQIRPTAADRRRAEKHFATVSTRLKSTFETRSVKIVGSYSRGTAIRHHSDLDCFVEFSRSEAQWGDRYVSSSTLLSRVRDDLLDRYQQTDIRTDAQVVVALFTGFDVEVVPAFWIRMKPNHLGANRPVYKMPDGSGDWLETSPDIHNEYIASEDQRSRGKLKSVARLIKFWRECRSPRIPLSSFHVELLLARGRACAGVKSYAQCMADALSMLADRGLAPLQDPVGISGYIPATKTNRQRDSALRSIAYSASHAKSAVESELEGSWRDAWDQWNIVFNDEFPRSTS